MRLLKRKFLLFLVFFLFLIAGAYSYIMQDFDKAPPTVYTNAQIFTMEENAPKAEVMWVENGIIRAIGSNEILNQIPKSGARQVDMQGAIVLPGFIDVHTHAALSALLEGMVDLSGFRHKNNQEVWAYLKEEVAKKKVGEWVICKGIDPILIPDLKTPTKQFLDEIAPQNPVVVFAQSLHSYWLNSSAFAKVGIHSNTPDPSNFSYYERDSLGNLTGLIAEQAAFLPVFEKLKEDLYSPSALSGAIAKTMKDYALKGNTTIVSTGLTINDAKGLMLFQHLSEGSPTLLNKLLEKLGYLPRRSPNPRHFVYIRHDMSHLMPKERKNSDDFYDIIGIKHWYDGSPYIGSMYLKEAYQSTPLTVEGLHIPEGHRGKALIEQDSLYQFIRNYHEKGWQVAVHTQGDAAIEEVLEVFEKVNKEVEIGSQRHRLEHCLLFPESHIQQMKALNITPSFHINHLYYYGNALQSDLLGGARAEAILPVGSVQKEGVKYSLHADQPMFDSRPFRLIQTAVERKTRQDTILGQHQALALMDAFKAVTVHAAWQIHREDEIGSLEEGKYADFIVVDKNPFEVPVSKLEEIQVLKTFVNGNEVRSQEFRK